MRRYMMAVLLVVSCGNDGKKAGEPCSSNDECAEGLICDNHAGGSNRCEGNHDHTSAETITATSTDGTDASTAGTSTDTTAASSETTTGSSTGATTTGGVVSAGCGEPDAPSDLFCPQPQTSWQWQLTGMLDVGVDVAMFDVDLFDTPSETITTLHADRRVVVCYFSAGSHEDWRPDAAEFPMAAIGNPLDGWPGERWLDIRDPVVRDVLAARLDLAVDKACDGVEPDNVDGYANDSGFALTAEDQLDFNRWLADAAHARGLSVGLKNDLEQASALVDDFDWALNEECVAYDECDLLDVFIGQGKAVFHVEYVDDAAEGQALADQVCPVTTPKSFSTLIKQWDLGAWHLAC